MPGFLSIYDRSYQLPRCLQFITIHFKLSFEVVCIGGFFYVVQFVIVFLAVVFDFVSVVTYKVSREKLLSLENSARYPRLPELFSHFS